MLGYRFNICVFTPVGIGGTEEPAAMYAAGVGVMSDCKRTST